MATLKIKKEFHNTQIGFNNSALPLGMRDDIDVLAKIAIDGNDQYLKNLFETLPEEKEVIEIVGEKFLNENPVPEVKNNEKKDAKK